MTAAQQASGGSGGGSSGGSLGDLQAALHDSALTGTTVCSPCRAEQGLQPALWAAQNSNSAGGRDEGCTTP